MKKLSARFLCVLTMLFLIIGNLIAVEKKEEISIHDMNFYQIIELLKRNEDNVRYADVTICPDSDINKFQGIFHNVESMSIVFKDYSINNLLEIIIKDSKFSGETGSLTSVLCGNHGAISLYTFDRGTKIELTYISVTEMGFTFNGAGPRFETLFYNPKLANWLVERFEKAGLPKIAKKFKENKNLYEDYKKNKKWNEERIRKETEAYEAKIAEESKSTTTKSPNQQSKPHP